MKLKNYPSQLRKMQFVIIVAIICFTTRAFSQGSDKTESPYFTIFCNDTSVVDLPLMSTNIKATISGVIANVEIEQVYQNAGDSALDATYVFPMSTNAAVYSMQMVVDERVINAVIKRRAEAQQIFDSANAHGQTASLLEEHRPNVFQMSLANINPGNKLIVRMTYSELIEPEKGVYQFVLPSIVGPRYSTNGEEWITQTHNDSLAVSNTAWNVELTINAGMPVTAFCSSHETSFTYDGETAHCHLETHPGKDFIVDYTLSGNQIETGLLLYEGEKENFFLSIIQPPKPEVQFKSPKREYVFIMDVSGSMQGPPIQVSKELIINLLNDLTPDDKFNILFFSGGNSVLAANSLPVSTENINKAINMIDAMNAGGGTEILPAMQRALTMEGTASYSRTFVILTDGNVAVEKKTFDLIREHLGDANFFSFGIGSSVNRHIIEGIAYVGEGESFVVTNENEADSLAETFKEYIERPALTNIQASFTGVETYDIEPYTIPDVFAERPIIIYGKYKNASGGSITVSGDYADGIVSSTLNFADYNTNMDKNTALKYLWARKRIKLMSDYGIASNEDDTVSIEEEITQLGLKYNLVTKYTSFVAVDSNAVTNMNDNSSEGDDYDGGGLTTLIDDREICSSDQDIKIIQILGSNVTPGSILNIRLLEIETIPAENLVMSVVDVHGNVLRKIRFSVNEIKQTIKLNLAGINSGLYFVTLSSNDRILDTEKFVVVK